MKRSFDIHTETGQMYMPKDLRENGFEGKVEAYAVGDVVVIVSTTAAIKGIRKALEFVASEIEDRALVSK